MNSGRRSPQWRYRAQWAFAVGLVAWWTLLPFAPNLDPGALQRAVADVQWVPFVERGRAPLWSDVLGNVALFLPFGITGWRCLEGRRGRLWAVLLGAALASLTVEVLQLALPARRTSATDLVVDVVGTAGGAALGRLWEVRGRAAARHWWGGGHAPVLALLLAAILLAWAVLPGLEVPGDLWSQTQRLSSSFRRFPGWQLWWQRSWHPFLLGAVFALLAGRSGTGSALGRGVFGFGCAVLLGLGLELAQLTAPSRSPDIFAAVGFGAGGLLALGLAGAPRWVVRGAAVALVGAGFLRPPLGDNPGPQTLAVLVLGGVLLYLAASGAAASGDSVRFP